MSDPGRHGTQPGDHRGTRSSAAKANQYNVVGGDIRLMPYGKSGEILCAVCQERLKTTDKTIRMESSNALAHAKCAGLAIATVGREHVRLLLFKATRCRSCLMKSTDLRETQLHAILEA